MAPRLPGVGPGVVPVSSLSEPAGVGGRPAVFLDRDGTLVRDVHHGADPAALEVLPGVVEALAALQAAGYALVVVTNQSGVARGLFTVAEARRMGRSLAALLAVSSVRLAGYYLCPHHPEGAVPGLAVACGCRKPAPGLLARSAAHLGLDLARSWMIGDAVSDVEAGRSAGARPLLLDIGRLRLPLADPAPPVARSLPHAAAQILTADGHVRLDWSVGGRTARRRAAPDDCRATGEPSAHPSRVWCARAARDGARLDREALVSGPYAGITLALAHARRAQSVSGEPTPGG